MSREQVSEEYMLELRDLLQDILRKYAPLSCLFARQNRDHHQAVLNS